MNFTDINKSELFAQLRSLKAEMDRQYETTEDREEKESILNDIRALVRTIEALNYY